MAYKCFSLLPICACFLQFFTTLASYLIGILGTNNIQYLPHSSDLGEVQPERGIFNMGMSISSGFTFTVILIRCMQVHTFYPRICLKMNVLSFITGFLMIVGQNLVPAFSLKEHAIIHYTGAVLYFSSGCLFMILQTHISRKHPFNHIKCIVNIRLVCACIGCICPVAYTLARLFAPPSENRYYIPQSSEWILALLLIVFFGSFAWDFSKIRIRLNSYEVSPRSRANSERLFSNKKPETII